MNRRQKIIVSVTGIFLVLLILVGLTYAFFLTRIRGNNNPTSISVTTANLELVYEDEDNGDIIGKDMIIEPNSNTPIGEKTFTVTNNGNATIENYAVIIENLAVKYVETQTVDGTLQTEGEVTSLVNGEDGNPDMKLVITCESSVEGKTCNGMDGFLPEKSGILLTNSIEEDEVQTYTATLTYLEDGTNQSDDMNKTIEGRFNIIDTNNTVDIEGTVENAKELTKVTINSEYKESVIYPDGTYRFVGVKPDIHTIRTIGTTTTEIGKISVVKGDSASTGTTTLDGVTIPEITITSSSRTATVNLTDTINADNLSEYGYGTLAYSIINDANYSETVKTTTDKDGEVHYYYGNVNNNYLDFAGMCWRVVKIQGDGSIKLILEDQNTTCNSKTYTGNPYIGFGSYGYKEGATGSFDVGTNEGTQTMDISIYLPDYINSSMAQTFKDFQENKLSSYLTKLKSGDWEYNGIVKSGDDILTDNQVSAYLCNETFGTWGDYVICPNYEYPDSVNLFTDITLLNEYSDGTPMYVATLTSKEVENAAGSTCDWTNIESYISDSIENSYGFILLDVASESFDCDWNNYVSFHEYIYFHDNGYEQCGALGGFTFNGSNSSTTQFRPAIVLKDGIPLAKGNGLKTSPYVIN